MGYRCSWSGRRALLPPPSAWRADALLNELLPGWWRRPDLHRCLGLMRPPSVLLLHSATHEQETIGAARRPRTGTPLFTRQMHVRLCLSGVLAPRRGFDPRTAVRQTAMIPFHQRGMLRALNAEDQISVQRSALGLVSSPGSAPGTSAFAERRSF